MTIKWNVLGAGQVAQYELTEESRQQAYNVVVNGISTDTVVTDTSPFGERQMYRLSLDIHLFTKSILPSDKYPDERCAPEKLK